MLLKPGGLVKRLLALIARLVATTLVIATLSFLLVRPFADFVSGPVGWGLGHGIASGLAWLSGGGVIAGLAAGLASGFAAGLSHDFLTQAAHQVPPQAEPAPLMEAVRFALLFFGAPLTGGATGGLIRGSLAPSAIVLRAGRVSGLIGAFPAGFVGAAAGLLSWMWVIAIDDLGKEPLSATANASLGVMLLVVAAGSVGGLAGAAGARFGRYIRGQPGTQEAPPRV